MQDHKCGAVQDFCTFHDTRIYFCVFCRKVIGAAKESQIQVSVVVNSDLDIDQYSEETLKENV